MNNESEELLKNNEDESRRPSWPYPTILILYAVIYLITPYIGKVIGLILFLGLMGACIWMAVSEDYYEDLKEGYPFLARSEYIINSLLFPVIVPLVVLIVLVVFEIV